jgi:hypothetical protein
VELERIARVVSDVTGGRRAELLKRGWRGAVRGLLMEMLYRGGGLRRREIGEMLGFDYSSVSVARNKYPLMADEDRKHLRLAERIELKLIQERKPLSQLPIAWNPLKESPNKVMLRRFCLDIFRLWN